MSLSSMMHTTTTARARHVTSSFLGLTLLAGCMGDKGTEPSLRDAATTIGSVRVAPSNIIMAVGDTVSLHLSGRSLAGAPLASFDSVQYLLQNGADSLRATVSPSGIVTAVAPTTPNRLVQIQIIAFRDGLARADQANIQITASRFSGATLSIHPGPSDSARVATNWDKIVTPVVANPLTGEAVPSPNLRFEFGPGDSTKLGCYAPMFIPTKTLAANQLQLSDCGAGSDNVVTQLNHIMGLKVGTAWVYATASVYGVTLRDSVQYTVTYPFRGYVQVFPAVLKASLGTWDTVTVQHGATITFADWLPPAVGATVGWDFSDPTAATAANPPSAAGGVSGNITPITAEEGQATRLFATPGSYTWMMTVHGGMAPFTGQTLQGVIIVK